MRNVFRILGAVVVAAGLTALAQAPARAVVYADGYVWAYSPGAAGYTAASGYEHNSAGGSVQITRSAAGTYQVRFAGMGAVGGVAHARPYGSGNTSICTVSYWGPSGVDELINVRCFNASGAAADSVFTASFTNRTAASGSLAYFWANDASSTTPYAPSSTYAYDSTGSVNHVYKQSTGVYMMYMGTVDAHYPDTKDNGVYEITAYGSAAVRCEVHGENDEFPTPIGVICVDANGNPADSRFSVTYAYGVSLLGMAPARANGYARHTWMDPASFSFAGYWNSGGVPAITRYSDGQYRVTFPGLAVGAGHATAGSRGDPTTYCHVAYWGSNYVNVNCFDNVSDAYVDSDFTVALQA